MKKTVLKSVVVSLMVVSFFTACHKDEQTDKTLTVQPGADGGKDANLLSCVACGYNTRNFGTQVEFDASAWTNNSNDSNIRGLIYFDLSVISPTATITSAKLSFYAYNSPANGAHSKISGSNASVLRKVTSAWDESTVTWDTQPSTSELNQVTLVESTSETEDYIDIDVTLLVKDMVKTPAGNFGLMLKLQTESSYRQLIFASSDNTDASKRPKLVVNYKQ